MVQKLLHSVEDARHALSIGRTRLYEDIKAGHLTVIKVGGKSLIPQSELDRYVAERLAEAKARAPAAKFQLTEVRLARKAERETL